MSSRGFSYPLSTTRSSPFKGSIDFGKAFINFSASALMLLLVKVDLLEMARVYNVCFFSSTILHFLAILIYWLAFFFFPVFVSWMAYFWPIDKWKAVRADTNSSSLMVFIGG